MRTILLILGGILAGYISDKTGCSGIVVAVMLFCAGPVVSFLHVYVLS